LDAAEEHTLNELAREVLDHAAEAYQLLSPDYRYLYVNNACTRHARKPREALLGRTMMDVYPASKALHYLQSCARA